MRNGLWIVAAVAAWLFVSPALAQSLRRFEIVVVDGRLAARGYIGGPAPIDDGAGLMRPYLNAMHDHWSNGPSRAAAAGLPGFDLFDTTGLTGHDLSITLTGASKWVTPPMMPAPGTIPDLVALAPEEEIFIARAGVTHTTNSPGAWTLVESIAPGGHSGLDFTFDIGIDPDDSIYVLEFLLATDAPGIAASDTIHILLSPDGVTMAERLHHASLYLEAHLGTPIPAPGALGPLAAVGLAALRRRRG